MDKLIDKNGCIDFGLFHQPVGLINYLDYALKTPLGRSRSGLFKKMMFKQFSFVGLDAPEVMAGVAVVDLKYAANAFFYVFDKADRSFVETKKTTLPFTADIAPEPDSGQARFKAKNLDITIDVDGLKAAGKNVELEAVLCRQAALPLRICTRTGYTGWTYTQKTAPIPVSGKLSVNGRDYLFSTDSCMAITDWTAGYFRRQTFWNWAAAATVLPDGRHFGMNFSCGVNETEATENIFWIDGKQVKVDNVKFQRHVGEGEDRWHITSADGRVDLFFVPVSARREHLNAWMVASRFTQFLGYFNGRLGDATIGEVELEDCSGWAEDHFAKW